MGSRTVFGDSKPSFSVDAGLGGDGLAYAGDKADRAASLPRPRTNRCPYCNRPVDVLCIHCLGDGMAGKKPIYLDESKTNLPPHVLRS